MFQEMELSSLVFFLYFRKELSERAKRKQNKKKTLRKKLQIFREIELSSPYLKKVLIFQEELSKS